MSDILLWTQVKNGKSSRVPQKSEHLEGDVLPCSAALGQYLTSGAAGAEHGVKVFDEDLGEDVDWCQRRQRDGAVTRPNQVDPKHTGQVGRAHLVDDALPRHLQPDSCT